MDADPPGVTWDPGSDARRLAWAVCAEAAPSHGSDPAARLASCSGQWVVESYVEGAGLICACGKKALPAVFVIRFRGAEATLQLEHACLKSLNVPEMTAQAAAHKKAAKVMAAAAQERRELRAGEREEHSPAVRGVALRNGWITKGMAQNYKRSGAHTRAANAFIAAAHAAGALAQDARPAWRVYRLGIPPAHAELMGIRSHQGVSYWRGAEEAAPAAIRNSVRCEETRIPWDVIDAPAEEGTT